MPFLFLRCKDSARNPNEQISYNLYTIFVHFISTFALENQNAKIMKRPNKNKTQDISEYYGGFTHEQVWNMDMTLAAAIAAHLRVFLQVYKHYEPVGHPATIQNLATW